MGELDSKQVRSAVKALLKHVSNETTKRDDGELWADSVKVYVQIAFKRTPPKNIAPVVLSIPHTLFREDTEVCVITKDPHEKWESLVEEADIDYVKKSMSVQHVKKNYKTQEAKRTLADSYDLFMADSGIVPTLPKLLGSKFFSKKKMPVVIDIKKADAKSVKSAIDGARLTTSVTFNGGPNSTVYVGHPEMEENEIASNVEAVCEAVAKKLKHKWGNIRAVYLKTRESVALPIYSTIDPSVEGEQEQEETLEKKSKSDSTKSKRTRKPDASEPVPPAKKSKRAAK